jgi:beta-glucosidase/6-phospho-beta-glucosidase/beta-galactosidase
MASFLDKKLDFKPAIEALKRVLGILFPFSAFMKSKNDTYHVGTIYNTKHGQPVTIRSEKIMSQYERMYGKIDSQFALDTVKMGIKREICDEIMRSDLFEWSIEDTAMGTRVAARVSVLNFNSETTGGTSGNAGNLGTSGGRSYY